MMTMALRPLPHLTEPNVPGVLADPASNVQQVVLPRIVIVIIVIIVISSSHLGTPAAKSANSLQSLRFQ